VFFNPSFFIGLLLGIAICTFVFVIALRRRNEQALVAERRAIAAERLAEIGAMTSGLAHEIKNPLSSVVLNAQLLREAVIDSSLAEEESKPLIRKVA
jgi:nitrogen-specific signal transduction histidine kinase